MPSSIFDYLIIGDAIPHLMQFIPLGNVANAINALWENRASWLLGHEYPGPEFSE